jgi:SAM-dependent methyltransferase
VTLWHRGFLQGFKERAMSDWEQSAAAWIASLGLQGDHGRAFVLDPAMVPLLAAGNYRYALDVGCGEGRLCRMMSSMGISTIGLDPTPSLIAHARSAHSDGQYVQAPAEAMPFAPQSFDLVVSCLSLIDIPDFKTAIAEMVRVLQPGGTLMIANLTSFNTAGSGEGLGWQSNIIGKTTHFALNNYLDERAEWEAWKGIRVRNHHRPLSAYMTALLGHGLVLQHFDEPVPVGAPQAWSEHYRKMPWFLIMIWHKPV